MYLPSKDCPRREARIHGGDGLIAFQDLAGLNETYGHVRLFSHITVHPGCSLGRHSHQRETEFYYIIHGEPELDDDGHRIRLHPGDVASAGNGASHALSNPTSEDVELIALIVVDK
jgi:uncharacterized cupin superfamily protein